MKRIALLISNTNGLEGTKADVGKFYRFLTSLQGGAWEGEGREIFSLSDISKSDLLACLGKVRRANFDYAVVLFSGHGGYRQETVLEINGNGEQVNESALFGLAPRQVSIFDCCRVMERQPLREGGVVRKSSVEFSTGYDIRRIIREKYEERIESAISQQVILYACSVDECSYDSKVGAVYIDKLVEVAEGIQNVEFLTVGQVHQKASGLTTAATSMPPISLYSDYVGPQHPEAHVPKCLSSQQLILSINPSFYCDYL
ncbi:MAG: caspase family protein [Treponematales bacterium]